MEEEARWPFIAGRTIGRGQGSVYIFTFQVQVESLDSAQCKNRGKGEPNGLVTVTHRVLYST